MLKVLIVDDTRSVHAFVRGLFARVEGVTVESAFDGPEALRVLSRNSGIDLVLLDWEMPILNGPEVLKKIKELGVSCPVIMMTTKNRPEDVQMMLNSGAAEYLMKPFTIDILVGKIDFVMGGSLKYAA